VIIMQRYIELKGRLQRVMAVVKVRGSAHSNDLRLFEITKTGIEVGRPLGNFKGLLTGDPAEIESVASAKEDPRKKR
jgi:circadian clock protein KaiC